MAAEPHPAPGPQRAVGLRLVPPWSVRECRVGEWTFSPDGHALRRGREERRLEPKAAAVLAALVAARGDVCGKAELLAAVWPGLHVTPEVLTNAIYELRKALGDDARQPSYIATVPRRGYRLVAPVGAVEARKARPSRDRKRLASLAAAVLVALGGWAWHRSAAPVTGGSPSLEAAAREAAAGWEALDEARPGAAAAALAAAARALAADPASPEGWALGAAAWAGHVAEGTVEPRQGLERAGPYLARALDLAPDDARVLTSRAFLRWLGAWDWAGAEEDLARAIAADPHSAPPRSLRAQIWAFSGRGAEALAGAEEAVALAPTSARARLTAGLVASLGGEKERAAQHYRAVLAMRPDHPTAGPQLAKLVAPPDPRPAVADPVRDLERIVAKGRASPGLVAALHAEAGRGDRALRWLERAVAEHDATVLFFPFDPRWEPWRGDPRYRAAMARLGRPQLEG